MVVSKVKEADIEARVTTVGVLAGCGKGLVVVRDHESGGEALSGEGDQIIGVERVKGDEKDTESYEKLRSGGGERGSNLGENNFPGSKRAVK